MKLFSSKSDEPPLKRRKLYIATVLVATVIFLALFNTGSWLFIQRMEHYLDDELGKRLKSIAELTVELLYFDTISDLAPDVIDPFSYDEIRSFVQLELYRIKNNNDLQGAYVVDDAYTIRASSQMAFDLGMTLSYLEEDSLISRRAWQGEIAVSPLHILEGNRFKTVYAPIKNNLGTPTAVLVLEANADFFELLGDFHRGRFIAITASAGLLLLLSIFLYWAVSLLLRTEASLRQAEKLAVMGQMAATVAHEIRNPLGVIKSTADVLKGRYNRAEKDDELFDYIPQEIRRLDRLVNDFLTLSREPKLQLTVNSLRESIDTATKLLQPEFNEAHISLQATVDGTIPPFQYDRDAVHQILLNILLNALQATPAGGKVTIIAAKLKKNVKIEVQDTGCGIDGDPLAVFEPFYTTKATGSGLGLSVTKKIVEGHGGSVTLRSTPGEGTTVTILMPFVTAVDSQ